MSSKCSLLHLATCQILIPCMRCPKRSYAVFSQALAATAWARLQTSSRLHRADELDMNDMIDWPMATSSSRVDRRRLCSCFPAEVPSTAVAELVFRRLARLAVGDIPPQVLLHKYVASCLPSSAARSSWSSSYEEEDLLLSLAALSREEVSASWLLLSC